MIVLKIIKFINYNNNKNRTVFQCNSIILEIYQLIELNWIKLNCIVTTEVADNCLTIWIMAGYNGSSIEIGQSDQVKTLKL